MVPQLRSEIISRIERAYVLVLAARWGSHRRMVSKVHPQGGGPPPFFVNVVIPKQLFPRVGKRCDSKALSDAFLWALFSIQIIDSDRVASNPVLYDPGRAVRLLQEYDSSTVSFISMQEYHFKGVRKRPTRAALNAKEERTLQTFIGVRLGPGRSRHFFACRDRNHWKLQHEEAVLS